MSDNKAQVIAASVVAFGVLALAGWFFYAPAPPPAPVALPGEPWPGALQLVGTWRLHQAGADGACRDSSDYVLTLAVGAPPLDDQVRGSLSIKSRQGGAAPACRTPERAELYDAVVLLNEDKALEMTMAARDCSEGGAPCDPPLSDRRGVIRIRNGALVFGGQAMKKD